ncbi:MAG TPA: hypothetical protein VIG07_06760 [Methylomirabilota bacterium]|jgi:hypothetical protein
MRSVGRLLAIVLGLAVAGCATSFSPQRVRSEIAAQTGGASLDFTRMAIRGWEPVVRARQPGRSTLVLVREGGGTIDDVVLLGAAGSTAIYARLRGTLSPELPRALGDAFQSRGPEGLRDELVREVIRQR